MDKAELKTLCREVLCEGIQRFPVLVGIVSRISGNDYEIFSVVSDTGVIKESDVYQLDCVYCRDVYKTKNTIAITEIDNVPGMKLHPLYDGFPIEVYISSPIIVNDKVWGTLNFSSLDITNTSFSKDDIQFNEEQAKKIATAISNIN
jgi:GAF domain-containing protein